MYALVEFKGKQYKAEKGAVLKVDRIDAEPGAAVDIDSVLLVSGDAVTVGAPYVPGAKVSAVVESHGKDPKIIVFKYMPKKDYRRKQGHRQQYSIIKIQDIASQEDIERAIRTRKIEGKHVIPVPSIEIKRNYPNIFYDAIKIFKRKKGPAALAGGPSVHEKSVVRPEY